MAGFDPYTHQPLNNRLLVRLIKTPAVNPGGVIILAPSSVKNTQVGEVISIAPELDTALLGHYVLVDLTAGIKVGENEAASYISYHIDDIQAIVDPGAEQEGNHAD